MGETSFLLAFTWWYCLVVFEPEEPEEILFIPLLVELNDPSFHYRTDQLDVECTTTFFPVKREAQTVITISNTPEIEIFLSIAIELQ